MGRTHIAHGSPNKQDTAEAHGAPLGEEEVRLTKLNIGWPPDAQFLVPEQVTQMFAERRQEWEAAHADWTERFATYRERHPELASEFDRRLAGDLPKGWADKLPRYAAGSKPIATRSASHQVMKALVERIPELVGGSGDLASSNKTTLDGGGSVARAQFGGRNLHFGVREHAMGAILNGMALHKGFRVFGSTFLIFSDYMRPAIRLAALMELPVIYVFTHDSIFLGEDGPTHQPVEHLASLRAMPNLSLIRPADGPETVEAWELALGHTHGPVALVLSRQDLRVLDHARSKDGVARGAYVLNDAAGGAPELILMASGSEVELAIDAQTVLEQDGIPTRVVSFPSWDRFAAQPPEYQAGVLPPRVTARLAIEAASPFGWERYVGGAGSRSGRDPLRCLGASEGAGAGIRLHRRARAGREPRAPGRRAGAQGRSGARAGPHRAGDSLTRAKENMMARLQGGFDFERRSLGMMATAAVGLTLAGGSPALATALPPTIATFSIVAFDSATGDLGVAVQSKFFAVGSVVPWAKAGVGAIATQASGNTTYGPRGLDLLQAGNSVAATRDSLVRNDPGRETRQVGIVDATGNAIAHTGKECQPWAGHRRAEVIRCKGTSSPANRWWSPWSGDISRLRPGPWVAG